MSKVVKISLFEVRGRPYCVASSDGEKVCDLISKALEEDRKVVVSFRNVTTLTTAFLYAAIGQLYGVFSEEKIRDLLTFVDTEKKDLALLRLVVENAKSYFKDPERYDRIVAKVQGHEEVEAQDETCAETQRYIAGSTISDRRS